jgi:hypothetical protein
MTKKNSKSSSVPQLTKIPLPISDTPLVVDLPDGQKLVIGKLTSGSVIEVATWRGTGRPDSRTSRLMLGMSNSADAISDEQSSQDGSTPSKKLNRFQSLTHPIMNGTARVVKSVGKKIKQIRLIPVQDSKPKERIETSEYDLLIKSWAEDIPKIATREIKAVPKASPPKAKSTEKKPGNAVKKNVKSAKKGRIKP